MPGCRYSCASVNKPTGPVGVCCVGGWVQPLADNTILHLSESETGEVRLLIIVISYSKYTK